MAIPEIIYCAAGNDRFAKIAIDNGFTYGARLPGTVSFTPEFIDNDWRNPNLDKYEECLNAYRPRLATVLDFEREEQFDEVMTWANMASNYVKEAIIIIPKITGYARKFPEKVNGIDVRLAFSWPTSHGKADWMVLYEIADWKNGIHILGGNPEFQYFAHLGMLKLPRRRPYKDMFLSKINVVSVDANMHLKMATKYNSFFNRKRDVKGMLWPTILDYDGQRWGDGSDTADAPYEAFRRSSINIMKMWNGDE